MFVIADSGSTKTDWLIVDNQRDERRYIQMEGLNPYHQTSANITKLTQKAFAHYDKLKEISQVFFYGSGCATPEKNNEVKNGLLPIFSNAEMHIESDILGAARALFGRGEGMAIILGTGSNSVIYNGNSITKGIRSTGYILGDEGSGSYLGRMILQSYFRKEFDDELTHDFENMFEVNHATILENIYMKPAPNRYLASFAVFANRHLDNPLMMGFVTRSFEDYFNYQLSELQADKGLPLGVVGSIGFHFKEVFSSIAQQHGYKVDSYLQQPIDGLYNYHSNEL